jgi:hypothetical protein
MRSRSGAPPSVLMDRGSSPAQDTAVRRATSPATLSAQVQRATPAPFGPFGSTGSQQTAWRTTCSSTLYPTTRRSSRRYRIERFNNLKRSAASLPPRVSRRAFARRHPPRGAACGARSENTMAQIFERRRATNWRRSLVLPRKKTRVAALALSARAGWGMSAVRLDRRWRVGVAPAPCIPYMRRAASRGLAARGLPR